jgi:dTDP-glucose 4,6-dehydratase
VYGDPLEHPQRETYAGNVNSIGLRACYDESKRFGEALTWEYRRKHGVRASIVRLFNTYGPRMHIDDGRAVPAFIGASLAGRAMPVFGTGTQTRSFCYVADTVEALMCVAEDAAADGAVLNIGNPHEITMLELALAVSDATGAPYRVEFTPAAEGDPARRRPDIALVRERYGWEPRTELLEGLCYTVLHFRQAAAGDSLAEAA